METAEEVGFKTDEDYFEKLFSFTPEIRIQNCGETAIYIPVMEMLSISKGLLALYHDRDISFAKTEIDILAKAEKGKTKEITNNAVNAINILSEHIGGEVVFDSKTFFVDKKDGTRIPFSLEASGFRKFGLLWILLRNGLLEKDTTLFWDEPENSLNPELIPVLVELLLELSRNGVQIFIATHSELLASYFDALSKDTDQLSFFSLYKDDGQIKYDQSTRFDLLVPNNLTAEQARLYEKEIAKGLGNGKR
jgi:AAA15 family ATPase/GTPase